MKPSKYQQDFYREVITTKNNVALKATAGAGKTTSIVEAAKLIPLSKKSIFLAFNKRIVKELKERLPNAVLCSTMHSLGMKAIMGHYSGDITLNDKKQIRFIEPLLRGEEEKNPRRRWAKIYQVDSIMRLARARMTMDIESVCDQYAIDATPDIISITKRALRAYYAFTDDDSKYGMDIDFMDMVEHCVRNKEIRMPQFDFVIVDELQDLSRLDHLFVNKLKKMNGGRIIGVGDPHQCQPAGTMVTMANGFTRSIERIKEGDKLLQYDWTKKGKGRYKESTVLKTAKRKIKQGIVKIQLESGETSRYTFNHKIIICDKKGGKVHEILVIDILMMSTILGLNYMFVVDGIDEYHWERRIVKIESIEIEEYKGYVYSLQVSGNETYIADQIVTHNSVYSFRGADPQSFEAFEKAPHTTILPLSICYRCDKAIIREAQSIYPDILPFDGKEEGEVREGQIEEIQEGDMVICRNTRPLVAVYMELIMSNKRAHIVGKDMEKGLLVMLVKFEPDETLEVVKPHLNALLVNLSKELASKGILSVKNHPRYCSLLEKTEILLAIFTKFSYIWEVEEYISQMFDDEERDGVSLMTIHKSKGGENDTVFVIESFEGKVLIPSPYAVTLDMKVQEQNLLFVSRTRARHKLIKLNL